MPRLALLVLLLTSTLHAQFPAAAGGLTSLLTHPPGIMQVTSLTRGPASFKLSVQFDDGSTSSFTSSGASESDLGIVSRLEEGRRYAMPQYLIDLLGYEQTAAIVRLLPNPQVTSFLTPPPRFPSALLSLGKDHPFRAVVLDRWMDDGDYSLVLQAADSRLLHVAGSFDNEAVKKTVQTLQRGETFEFPIALEPKSAAQPASGAARVLGRYIGEWSGRLEDDPGAKIVMKCHWKVDGTGIWREISFSHDDDPATLDISLITYDEAEKQFVVVDPAKGNAVLFHTVWKADERSFVSTLPAEPGQSRVNTATFSSDDRIDWQTVTQDAAGKTIATRRGSYQRVAAVASTLKLPSSTPSSPSVSFQPSVTNTTSISSSGQKTIMTQTTSSSTSSPMGMTPEERSFAQLRELPPFRGKVASFNIGPDSIATTITVGDGRRYLVHHKRDENWDLNLAIAKRLKYDETFEFPDVVSDGYSTTTKEPDENMRRLASFIGEWRLTIESPPDKGPGQNVVRYFWKNDGKGIWRENRNAAHPASLIFTSLITHDPATGSYLETTSHPQSEQFQSTTIWDAASQTLTLKTQSQHPALGTQLTSSRHLISKDRIEWHSTRHKADGTLIDEFRGHYERIKP
ncbi:MAG: hypothetical protein ACKVY0_16930 [Prosthecobacter sp.]|uniref:hypothetical protein n=1 Tax=Prosthecobacter sp. TaxID=1965333 RepID=UPI0038FDF9B4